MSYSRIGCAAVLAIFSCTSTTLAERVGYQFTGAFMGSGSQTYSLFGKSVPKNSVITGTFSYDTTTVGVDTEPGVRTYHQLIEGGFTLDIHGGAIQLSARDYTITVANDYESPASDWFSVDYNYDSANGILPDPILEHGVAWNGPRAFIKFAPSWDAATFTDPSEPQLTADRPTTPNAIFQAIVGSSSMPRMFNTFSITPIVPATGDFNVDGKVDGSDLIEWRKAFGHSESQFLYADCNHDGEVDGADYVRWRKASSPAGIGAVVVPEPCGLPLLVTCFMLFLGRSASCLFGAVRR
ncbi:MAG: hypothetical protein IT425_04735 [Pirellulales bacterium]|nr:hypothetical protein [Pirellulales bacterium]